MFILEVVFVFFFSFLLLLLLGLLDGDLMVVGVCFVR